MSEKPEFKIIKVQVHDTGIGREAGYANDQELIETYNRELESLPPEVRRLVGEIDRRSTERFIGGS